MCVFRRNRENLLSVKHTVLLYSFTSSVRKGSTFSANSIGSRKGLSVERGKKDSKDSKKDITLLLNPE